MAEKVTSLFGGHIAAFRNSTLLTAERTPIRSRCYVLHKLGSKGNAGGHSGREVIFADRARRRNNHVGPPQPGTSVRKPPRPCENTGIQSPRRKPFSISSV